MIEFVWPQSDGEWWAWSSAVFMLLSGLFMLVMARRWMEFVGMLTVGSRAQSIAEIRGPLGGGSIGLALIVILLHPQPLLYLALGSVYLFSAIGRLISIVVDKGSTRRNWITLGFEILLAFSPIAYAVGYIA